MYTSSITNVINRGFVEAVMTVKWITFGGRAAPLTTSVPPDFGKSFLVKAWGKTSHLLAPLVDFSD